MEHCLTFALWTFFFIGYLHAKPVTSATAQTTERQCLRFDMADLGLDDLEYVSCGANVTFTSPEGVEAPCYTAALTEFMEGLDNATKNCTDEDKRSLDTLEELENSSQGLKLPVNSSECRWEKKLFSDFVKDLETFVENVNDAGKWGC